MTDETNPPAGVPLRKSEPARADATAERPRSVLYALTALIVAAVFSVLAAVGVASQKDWLKREQGKANVKAVSSAVSSATASAAKKSQDVAKASASASAKATKSYPVPGSKKLNDQVSSQVSGSFISAVLVLLVMAFLGYGAYRGRHWTRWGVTGFFILATFTGTGVGLLNLLNAVLASGVPAVVRIPSLLSALAMVVAVVMVNMRTSVNYFALSRPAPRPGVPQRRGLFSRPAPPPRSDVGKRTDAGRRAATTRPAEPPAAGGVDRSKSKKRANADAVARGAELARTRAKASKSRRTDR